MPVFKSLPIGLKGGALSLDHALLLRRMSLNFTPQHRNPFEEEEEGDGCEGGSPASSLLDGAGPRDRSPFNDEEDENWANEGRKSAGGGSAKKGSLHFKSPLKTLGKLGKTLRMSGRGGGGQEGCTPPRVPGSPSPSASSRSSEKKKRGRRSSEGSLLRFAGKYRDPLGSRRDGVANGEDGSEGGGDSASRRLSFMKMVGLGKKKEAGPAAGVEPQQSQEPEPPEAPQEVKPREPLSVLEILQLVKKRDLLLADGHILELEQECSRSAATTTDSDELKDGGRRKAKDVELLYQELQKELWAVVQEALHTKTAGPNLGLVVQVLQQEEQVDRNWAQSESAAPGGPRPRQLKQRWKEALEEAADSALPQRLEATTGQLDRYLERLRARMVEDLGAAKRNVVNIYPEDFQPFQVYLQSYHRAMTRRLQELSEQPLETCDVYFLLDFLHNIYTRDVLQPVCMTAPPPHCQLTPLLPPESIDRLELDCLNSVRATVTTELSAVLDEEERRWAEPAEGEEFQLTLAKTVIQRLTVDLERSASVSAALGARVAQCTLNGLADFLYSFQKKVEMFHEAVQSGALPHQQAGYEVKTIALVNCCPPLRGFVRRCVSSESPSEDSLRRANRCLDHIVQQGVQELTERMCQHIKPFFERMVKKKWLNSSEALDQVVVLIRETFQRYRRLDGAPYQLLVSELHRRVLVEYLRATMRGRLTCTSLKMRRRVAARLREDGQQIAELFKDLESPSGWLDNALLHLSEMVQLEDVPALQMEVAVLVREFPDIRKKHVASMLDLRGMRRQAERQEILNVVQDIGSGDGVDGSGGGRLTRDRAVFAEVQVTSEVRCLNLGLGRLASFFGGMRPHPRKDRSDAKESVDDGL